jgi:outer membrane protein TolC
MKKISILKTAAAVVLFAIANCTEISAQRTLTLEDCRRTALTNSKTTAIADITERKSDFESRSYFANFLPRISASAFYLYTASRMNQHIDEAYLPTFSPDMLTGQLQPNTVALPDGTPLIRDGAPVFTDYAYFPGMDIDFTMSGSWFAGVQAEQPLFAGGKIMSAWRMSQTGREIARLNIRRSQAEVIEQVDEAFFLHLRALEAKRVATAFQTVVNELLSNVRAALETGMKTRNDVMKVQVQVNRAELQLRRADNAIRLSRMNLCQLMGLPLDEDISVSDDDGNTPELTLSPDCSARPEYAMLDRQIELKDRQIGLVRSDFLPSAGVLANYGFVHGPELMGIPILKEASFSALFTLKVPIFHWGEGMNKIRAAKAEKQIMQLQRDELAEKMQLEARLALDRVEESRLETELTGKALSQAEENMNVCRNMYEKGMDTLAAFLEAQTAWQQAWMENIEAKTNLRLNTTRYLKATGQLIVEQ